GPRTTSGTRSGTTRPPRRTSAPACATPRVPGPRRARRTRRAGPTPAPGRRRGSRRGPGRPRTRRRPARPRARSGSAPSPGTGQVPSGCRRSCSPRRAPRRRARRVRPPARAPRAARAPAAPSTGRRRSRACATLTRMSLQLDETAELGNVATRLLFENERVKVWEMLLEPGESSDLHRHGLDYLLYILEATRIDPDRPDRSSATYPVQPGQLVFVPRGGTERAVNRSAVRFRELLVELKDQDRS